MVLLWIGIAIVALIVVILIVKAVKTPSRDTKDKSQTFGVWQNNFCFKKGFSFTIRNGRAECLFLVIMYFVLTDLVLWCSDGSIWSFAVIFPFEMLVNFNFSHLNTINPICSLMIWDFLTDNMAIYGDITPFTQYFHFVVFHLFV